MTSAEQKAKELVDKYMDNVLVEHTRWCRVNSGHESFPLPIKFARLSAKQCAIIACDEILNSDPYSPHDGSYYEVAQDRFDAVKEFWQQVKQSIQSL